MASVFSAGGAVEHFVKFRNGQTYYLGTATLGPEIERRPAYIDIKNDLAGRSVPMQKAFDGSQHIINTTLNRFDIDVYRLLSENDLLGGGDTKLDRGQLVLGSTDFELIMVNALAAAGATAGNYPIGRRYWSCVLLGSRESAVGTRVAEVSLVLEANGLFSATDRSFSLFTEVANDVLNGLPTLT